MKFDDYLELKEKAQTVGVEDCPALKQLLHLIQSKEVAVKHYRAYLREMHQWERNCLKAVEKVIKDASEVKKDG